MGSHIMEPEDFAAYAASIPMHNFDNLTTICAPLHRIHGQGSVVFESNPLRYALPLLLAQFSLASAGTLVSAFVHKPIWQPIFAAQMLGGIIVGPSGFARFDGIFNIMFPPRGFIMLDILSCIGYMLYFFLIGVEMDPLILKKLNKSTIVPGILTPAVSLGLTEVFSLLLLEFLNVPPSIARKLPVVAQAESMLAIPTVASLLAELNIINSELGRAALRSSMVSGLFSFSVTLSMVLAGQSIRDKTLMITTISAGIVFTAIMVFVIRPVVLCMIMKSRAAGSLKQGHFVALLVMVLLSGFVSHAVGLHIYYGPLIFGIIMPVEPPVGSALKEKLSAVTHWMFLPFFFLKNGLAINALNIKLRNYMIFFSVALVAAIGKFIGAFATFLYYKMPGVDAAVLGFIMSSQGLLELGLFKMMKKDLAIDNEAFGIMCISLLVITGSIAPVIKRLSDPSRRYLVYKRRTVTNAKPDSELRLLICLHEQDNVPTAVNLLEVLNPTLDTPLYVFTLHLVELVGLEKPLLVPHKTVENPTSYAGPSEAIFKAFKHYEESNMGTVSVAAYTGISPCAKMHDDACALAIEERTSLIIIPYYRKLYPNGARDSRHKAAQIMNKNLLDKAPCSVGIVVDRGLSKSLQHTPQQISQLRSWSPYRVGVIFLGGDDDREALAIGQRMARNPNINLTMIRLLVSGNVAGTDTDARKLDSEFLSEFRQSMARNSRVTYIEEVVMDWSGTVAVIRSMEYNYQLILVGRTHDRQSPLLSGIQELRENAELGAIGQVLTSADFRDNATVLVVQQRNQVPNDSNVSRRHSPGATNSKDSGEDEMPIQGRSPFKGDEMPQCFEEDESDADSSSDITCIIKDEVSRSHVMCVRASGISEASAKHFSKMTWLYDPVIPQSSRRSNSEAEKKRPAQSNDFLESQKSCTKARSQIQS